MLYKQLSYITKHYDEIPDHNHMPRIRHVC